MVPSGPDGVYVVYIDRRAASETPDAGQPKNFLRPCLLLLLKESPAHGYELLERLREFDIDKDPGGLYRTLRAMEHEALVASNWEPSFTGPDRRRYQVTPAGEVWLDAWTRALEDTRHILDRYLARHARATAPARG